MPQILGVLFSPHLEQCNTCAGTNIRLLVVDGSPVPVLTGRWVCHLVAIGNVYYLFPLSVSTIAVSLLKVCR